MLGETILKGILYFLLKAKYLKRQKVNNRWKYWYKPESQRGAHEFTKQKFEKKTKLTDSTHKDAIEKILQNNGHVNLKILRDYPDLVKKYNQESRIIAADKIRAKVKASKAQPESPKVESKIDDKKSMEEPKKLEGNYGSGINISKVNYGGIAHYKIKSPYLPDLVSKIQELKSLYYLLPKEQRIKIGTLTFDRDNKAWYIPLDYRDKISEIMQSYPEKVEQNNPIEKIQENTPSYSTKEYRVGEIIDTPAGKKTVIKVNSKYISEDGLSFNLLQDKGYLYQPVLRDSTSEDLKKDAEFKNEQNVSLEKDKLKKSLRNNVFNSVKSLYESMGNTIKPEKIDYPKGKEVNAGFRGDILILGDDNRVYRAIYNGRDGDDWSYNNSGSYIIEYSENPEAVKKIKTVISENDKYISVLKQEELEKDKIANDFIAKKEQNKIKLNRGNAEYDPHSDSYTVSFPYNQNDITEIKKISGSKYNPESKTWSIPNDGFSKKKLQEIFRLPAKELSNNQKRKIARPYF